LLGDIEGEAADAAPGVVDEDVEFAEMRGGVLDSATVLSEIGDVHLKAERPAAQSFDFAGEIVRGVDVAQTESDIGSRVSASESDGAAEASRGAGD
jgi:hypothetical protein